MEKKFKKIVVKFGTESLMKNGELFQSIFNNVARQIVESGITAAIISSGAIQAGKENLKNTILAPNLKKEDLEDKYLAGIGMPYLLEKWKIAFWNFYKCPIAQVLITHANLTDEEECKSIKNGILQFMRHGVLPIINKNDVVSSIEIDLMKKGISENDILAQRVAQLIGADAILFITDVGGIYNDDPKQNSGATLYNEIDVNNLPSALQISDITSQNGRGGMAAKLKVGSVCSKAGIYTVIAGLKEENAIVKFVNKEPVGTLLTSKTKSISLAV